MTQYTIDHAKELIQSISNVVLQNKDYLGELDSKSGDGDLGMSMEAAFEAINKTCHAYKGDDLGEMLLKSSLSCNKAAPSTMGTLISSGILSIAKELNGKSEIRESEIIDLPRIFTEGIKARGKADLGDKTILDALIPMYQTIEKVYSESNDLDQSISAGAEAAETAAEETKGMQAKIGRARWLGSRAAENPDAGAMLCAIVAKSLL